MIYLWFCWWGFTGFTFRSGNTPWFCHSCGSTSCFGCSCPLWTSWWNGLFLRRDLNFLFTPFFFPLLILFILSSFHLSQFGAGLHRTCFRGWVLFGFGVRGNCLRAALGRGDGVYPSLKNKKNYVTNTNTKTVLIHGFYVIFVDIWFCRQKVFKYEYTVNLMKYYFCEKINYE